jgi:hypothetical protein
MTAAPAPLGAEVTAVKPGAALPACAPSFSDRLIRNRPSFGVSAVAARALRDIATGPVEDSEIFVMPPIPQLHVVRTFELPRSERSNRLGPPSASAGSTDADTEGVEPLDGAMVARTMLAASMVSGFELFRSGLTIVDGFPSARSWVGLRARLAKAAPIARAWGWFRVPAMRLATCGACVLGFMVLWSTSDSSVSSASAVTTSSVNTPKAAVATTVSTVKQMVYERSATDLKEDFSVGLSDWEGGADWSSSWNYDERGGVKPGSLAILKPSVKLADYTFEFLGEIERKTLGFTVRSADIQNYQAVKLVVKTPGPLPVVSVVRYAVVDGKVSAQSEKRLPLTVYKDTIYQVRVTARGDTFTLAVNDLVVDDWTESRLGSGGVGFFTPKGDQARVFQVRVYHQADTLGKALAYIAKK